MHPKTGTRDKASSGEIHETGSKRKVDEAPEIDQAGDEEPDAKKARPKSSNRRIEWLLGDEAFSLAFPALPPGHGEIDWDDKQDPRTPPPEDAGKQASHDTKTNAEADDDLPRLTYPDSSLTPFQDLVAALLLSKPISHRLGLRTINTLLNPPFGLRTPRDLDEAGFEGRRKVMWEARTQYKEKTAVQLGDLVEGVRRICGDEKEGEAGRMTALREKLRGLGTEEAQEKAVRVLTEMIKGVGPTGAAIFLRRVQGEWDEVFPYADERALKAAVMFGVIDESEGVSGLAGKVDGDRGKFVRVLDVLVGIQLEHKMDEALERVGRE